MSSNESGKLKIGQLGELHNVLAPITYAYKCFGSQIKVENHILLEIEKTNCDFSEKLYKVLEYRLKQLPLLTWHDIVRALRSPAVHEEVLASEIESQYIPCSSYQSQLVSPQSFASIGPDSTADIYFQARPSFSPYPQSPPYKVVKAKQKHSQSNSQANTCTVEPYPFQSHSSPNQTLLGAPFAKRPCLQQSSSPPLSNIDSGHSELFQQFIDSVKSFYRFSPVEIRTQVLKLPTPGKKFINLACIDRKTEGLRTEYDDITEAMVRDGNVDVIEGRKCPIDMSEIAANLPATTFETMILVEGAPGVGKSTFAWEFCRRWERGEIAQQYALVLLLRLRDDRISKAKCWKDLIYHSSSSILQAVISELEARSGFGVLFILEGYDELPDECRNSSSPLLKLISGEELHLATLIITSRPWATCDVLKKFKYRIFQHIEVLGFTRSQISSYIQSVLSEEEVEDLEKKLLKHYQIRKCMYIPLNCAIVVTVYQESKALGVDMPSTITELYLALSHTILLRYLRANDTNSDPIECFEELPHHVHRKFKYLCELAYSGVAEAGDQIRLIFTGLPLNFDGLGFMDSIFELFVTRKGVASHNFLHLTFQEFLAAVHISKMEAEQRMKHFKRSDEGRLRVVLRFLAGLTHLKDFNSSNLFHVLNDPDREGYSAIDYSGGSQWSWVYEARRGDLIRDTFDEDTTVEFVCEDQFDSSALGYCIANSCCQWVLSIGGTIMEDDVKLLINEVKRHRLTGGVIVGLRGKCDEYSDIFKGIDISLDGLNLLFKELNVELNELALHLPAPCSNISWPELSTLRYLTIYTDRVRMHTDRVVWELHSLLPYLSGLEVLTITGGLSSEDCSAVANHVANTTTLEILSFLDIDEPIDIDLEKICAALLINESHSLHTLDFSGVQYISPDYLLEYILRGTEELYIEFPYMGFCACQALQIAKALKKTKRPVNVDELAFRVDGTGDIWAFTELFSEYLEYIDRDVKFFNIDDEAAKTLGEYLHDDSVIEDLDLNSNYISDVGVEHLAAALRYNKTLTCLDLGSNELSDDGAKALARALKSNTTLKRLDLSSNNIGNSGAKALAETLESNTTLESLNLGGNKIGDSGAKALDEALESNTTLKSLNLGGNKIGDSGAKALDEACKTHHGELKLLW